MSKTAELPNGNTKYPWKRWTSGRQFTAIRGKHFWISPASFRNSLTARASNHGLAVVTRVKGNKVTFQFSAR